MSEPVSLVLGLETTARELDSRLILAALHARANRRFFVVGGLSGQRFARDFEGALCVGKHLVHPTAASPLAYYHAKQNGCIVVHLAEEGGVFMGDETDWAWDLDHQLDATLLDPEDFVCTWGDFQRDHYRRSAANPENVRTTGHPRFDVYKEPLRGFYQEEADVLRRRHGRYVLWCSNFGMVNDPEGPFNTFSKMMGYVPEDDETRIRFIERWSYQQRTFSEYIELFHRLSIRRPDVSFIVRPHPSDNIDFLRWAFRGVANIKVIQEGAVAPWLIAAQAMLHDGCTTGVEAHFLGTPIVNFRPIEISSQEFYLPNLFGTMCSTQSQTIDVLLSILEDDATANRRELGDVPERAARLFANFRHDSFDLFTSVLAEAERALGARRRSRNWRQTITNEVRFVALEEGKHLLRRAFSPQRFRTAMHAKRKFPGFERESVLHKLSRVRALTGVPLAARFHGPNILELNLDR